MMVSDSGLGTVPIGDQFSVKLRCVTKPLGAMKMLLHSLSRQVTERQTEDCLQMSYQELRKKLSRIGEATSIAKMNTWRKHTYVNYYNGKYVLTFWVCVGVVSPHVNFESARDMDIEAVY